MIEPFKFYTIFKSKNTNNYGFRLSSTFPLIRIKKEKKEKKEEKNYIKGKLQ